MIERIDNPDGTTTFRGVDVTIPTSVAKTHDVVAVRSGKKSEGILTCSDRVESLASDSEWVYVILSPRPTWKPPASLKPGKYEWRGEYLFDSGFSSAWASKHLRDWTDPPKTGYWQVHEDGTATYLGAS